MHNPKLFSLPNWIHSSGWQYFAKSFQNLGAILMDVCLCHQVIVYKWTVVNKIGPNGFEKCMPTGVWKLYAKQCHPNVHVFALWFWSINWVHKWTILLRHKWSKSVILWDFTGKIYRSFTLSTKRFSVSNWIYSCLSIVVFGR